MWWFNASFFIVDQSLLLHKTIAAKDYRLVFFKQKVHKFKHESAIISTLVEQRARERKNKQYKRI